MGASGYGGGRRDFLGYYAMLGLDVEAGGAVTQADVKRGFREAALRWHPDRQKVRSRPCKKCAGWDDSGSLRVQST